MTITINNIRLNLSITNNLTWDGHYNISWRLVNTNSSNYISGNIPLRVNFVNQLSLQIRETIIRENFDLTP